MIESKTLYGLHIPHTAFPNATKATTKETTKATTNEVHVTKDMDIGTSHIIWWRIWATGFYPTTKGNWQQEDQFQVKVHILSVKIQIIVVYTSCIQTLQTHCLKPDYIVRQVLSINC